jgi:aromatic ring-cleaving dioxygenase
LGEQEFIGDEEEPSDERIWLGKCLEVRNALFQKQQKRTEAIDRSGA